MSQPLTFADLLHGYRVAAELTQEELAERAGISPRTVSDLERGVIHRPQRGTLQRLLDALSLAPADRAILQNSGARRQRASAASDAAPGQHNNLRVPPTSFVGRESERRAISTLLVQEASRLVTLIGPGGAGKTRLATHVALDVVDRFRNGACFVSLAGIPDASLVATEIARVLGIQDPGRQPARDVMFGYLREKEILLVLDNFEHLLDAAPLVVSVLSECPDVRVLATSREPLHIQREQEYPVPPLAIPSESASSLSVIAESPAVALFVDRARAVSPSFELTGDESLAVAAICRRLDGLPLAIELAAARIRVFGLRTLAHRLDRPLRLLTGGPRDVPERLQTMQNAIAWSYGLLNTAEQGIFRRLGVFIGGSRLQAIEAVCGGDDADVVDGVTLLVEKSLIRAISMTGGDMRYIMLEIIREYAAERAGESGEWEAARRAHALHFLRLAEDTEPRLVGPTQREALGRLDEDIGNFRAALRWSVEPDIEDSLVHTRRELGLRLAAALARFWQIRGYLQEGWDWLEQLLAPAPEQTSHVSDAVRAKALAAAAALAYRRGDLHVTTQLGEESLRLWQSEGDTGSIASILNTLANAARSRGDYSSASDLYQQSLRLREEMHDKWGIAIALGNLANIAQEQGDSRRAKTLLEESLALRRELKDSWGIASALGNLANAAQLEGSYAEARALGEESLARFRDLEDKIGIALCLVNLASLARDQGDVERACALSEDGLAIFQEIGDRWGTALAIGNLATLSLDRGDLGHASALYEDTLELYRELSDDRGIPLALSGLAHVARAWGDISRALATYSRSLELFQAVGDRPGAVGCLDGVAHALGPTADAVRLFAAATSLRERFNTPRPPIDRISVERSLAQAQHELAPEAFGFAWNEGSGLSLEQAVTTAMSYADRASVSSSTRSVPFTA